MASAVRGQDEGAAVTFLPRLGWNDPFAVHLTPAQRRAATFARRCAVSRAYPHDAAEGSAAFRRLPHVRGSRHRLRMRARA